MSPYCTAVGSTEYFYLIIALTCNNLFSATRWSHETQNKDMKIPKNTSTNNNKRISIVHIAQQEI